jgi:hypothetical protein
VVVFDGFMTDHFEIIIVTYVPSAMLRPLQGYHQGGMYKELLLQHIGEK